MTHTLDARALELCEVQRALFDAVVLDDTDDTNASRSEEPILRWVADNGLSALRRIGIYRDGYRARLVECLVDDYPAVQALLGEDVFERLCHRYIQELPPGISLNHYGARFAAHCRRAAPSHAPLACELAQLEWALVKAVHGSDARTLRAEQLAELSLADWETAALVPSPTLTLLETVYPVNAYFQAFRDGCSPEPPQPQPGWVAVCRSGFDVWRIALPDHLGSLLARSISGEPLARTLANAASSSGQGVDPGELQQAFAQWMRAGCYAGITHVGLPRAEHGP